jgi:uncharacterized cupin superfamily protein
MEMAQGVPEAEVREAEVGLAPEGDGWFIVNIADSQGLRASTLGSGAMFEADIGDFPQFGINVRVLEPGQPASRYHREDRQEAFLVLDGECTIVIEDTERSLRKGDFVHLPAGAAHVIVGAGDATSTVLMVGARTTDPQISFPVSETAARHGASVEEETDDAAAANAGLEISKQKFGRVPW